MFKKMIKTCLILAVLFSSQALCEVLVQDDFESYTYGDGETVPIVTLANQSSDWQGIGANLVKFVTWHPNKAYFSNSYWAENIFKTAYINTGASDITVSVDAYAVAGHKMEYFAVARCTDTQYVGAGILTNGTDVYARIKDSAGGGIGDYWFGAFDPNGDAPMHIDLTVEGENVTASFSTQGLSITLETTTTILEGTNAGFGGKYQWGYALGQFDNFVVTGSAPKLAGNLNDDNVVDLMDFAILSIDWMKCTNPADSGCDSYWK